MALDSYGLPTLGTPSAGGSGAGLEDYYRRSGATKAPLSDYLSLLGTFGGGLAQQDAVNRGSSNPSAVAQHARNIAHANYIASGGSGGRPTNTQLGLPTFGIGPQASSPEQIAMAQKMKSELMKRDIEGNKKQGWGGKLGGIMALVGAIAATAATGGAAAPLLAPAGGYAASKF